MAANNIVNYPPVQVGDERPIAVNVVPSDAASAVSATFALYQRGGNGVPIAQGQCTVENDNTGTTLTTPNLITFGQVGYFICHFQIVWNDGQVDNTVAVQINVLPLIT